MPPPPGHPLPSALLAQLNQLLAGVPAVVLLGKELRRDPPRALRELRARSAAAAVALRLGVPVAVSLEAPLRGQDAAGSALVAQLLDELGVAADRLVREEVTRSTREEAVEAGRLAARRGWRSLVVVTARYHQARAQRYFDELPGLTTRVVCPGVFQPAGTRQERLWIDYGVPDARAMVSERRSEWLFGALATALKPLPRAVRWRMEIAAGGVLRGVAGG